MHRCVFSIFASLEIGQSSRIGSQRDWQSANHQWRVEMNCWEFKKCGREPGGTTVDELGVCPAYPDHGRHCAKVAGTLCGGQVQGVYASKLVNCMDCDFYQTGHYDKKYVGSDL
jgi:hypothetical protein